MSTKLEPIGFWSYTSSDDTASRGQLSQLRRLLADDLQRLIGRDPQVHIFQDVGAIAKGEDWADKIHEALGAASFIIPILTPAFLQSEWCAREVLHFRTREQALGRNNLIFPFHFTDVRHVDPNNPREVFDKTVHALLMSRQQLDFRDLELEDPNHRDVRFKLRELSTAIRDALRANGPAPRPVPPTPSIPVPLRWASATGTDAVGPWADITVPAISGPPVTQRMRRIPAGRFTMGSPDDEPGSFKAEGPRQIITFAQDFWMFDTPCTQALWMAVMGGENPSMFQSSTRPVEQVSFTDVQAFITKINARVPGLNLILPSEAQWEYACRAGTAEATYAGPMRILGANNAPVLDKIAWYGGNSGQDFELTSGYDSSDWPEKQYPHKKAGTHPVKQKQPNGWGLYDMLGNVWEWCADVWVDSLEGAAPDGAPRAGGEAASRVLRGGSWGYAARRVRSASRNGRAPSYRAVGIGFRCARVQEQV